MNWSNKDLQKLKEKGLVVDKQLTVSESVVVKSVNKPKISVEKNTIELYFKQLVQSGLIENYTTEYKFHSKRKFRFDWYIPGLKLAIEYEGIMSEKSGHTTVTGYTKDLVKYNLAIINGFRVLRYNALNYQQAYEDIEKLINQ